MQSSNAIQVVKATSPQVFEFGAYAVRTAGAHDAPLFCAADVCAALGIINVSQAVGQLKPDEQTSVQHTIGRKPATFLTEAGLYKLIMRCRKPTAEPFVEWVTSKVLPAIRRKGYYSALEADQERQTELYLAQCFPHVPSKSAPLYRALTAALVRLRRKGEGTNPPWVPIIANMVYGWAMPIKGQQPARRSRNPKPNGSRVDHSMFSDEAKDAVKHVLQTGADFARISVNWEDWKTKMELTFGSKALQIPLMVPMLHDVNHARTYPRLGAPRHTGASRGRTES